MKPLKSLLHQSMTEDRILSKQFKSIKTQGQDSSDFVKGKFSKIEISQIEDAIQEYLQERNIPREELISLIHSRKNKAIAKNKGFFRDILEKSKVNRSLDQLYFFMSRKYSEIPTNRVKWSKEEDDKLKLLVSLKGFKWNEISQELQRKDVKVRYEKISRQNLGFSQGKWSKEETDLFINGMKSLQEKYNIKNPADFHHWTELSLIVKTRSFIQCRNKYIHSLYNLDTTKDFKVKWTLEDDFILLKKLKELGKVNDETEIIWNNIASKEWMPWTGACLQRRWWKLKSRIPSSLTTFNNRLHYISENIREISRTKYLNRDLLTLYSNQDSDSGIWTVQDSGELLSHITTLFSNAQDEGDVDWESLRFSSWDGEFLKKKWLGIKEKLRPMESLGFIGAVGFCKENLQNLTFEEDGNDLDSSLNADTEAQRDELSASDTKESRKIPKTVEKRKIDDKDERPKKVKTYDGIKDKSGEKTVINDKKSKNKRIISAEVIDNSSSDGQSVQKDKKTKIKKKKKKSKSTEMH